MADIKAVLFDAGNTVLDFRPSERAAIEILERRTGHQIDEAAATPFFTAAFSHAFGEGLLWVSDHVSEGRYWTNYYHGWLAAIGLDVSEELIAELVAETLRPAVYQAFPDARPVLEELRRLEIKIGLVSNAFPSMRLLIEHSRLDEFFDPAIYSCEVGHEKPELPIFELALAGIAVAPSQCLFIDDLPSNIEAAMSMGIRGLLLDRWDRHPQSPLPRISDLYAILQEV